jgi:hypothetical protein
VPGRPVRCVYTRSCLETSLVLRARSIAYFAPVASTVKQPDFRSEARVNEGATLHFILP